MKNTLIVAKCHVNSLQQYGYAKGNNYHLALYTQENSPVLIIYPLRPNTEGGHKLSYSSLHHFFNDWGYVIKLDYVRKQVNPNQLSLFDETSIK